MQPSSFNDPVLTFMQASTNSTPLHQTAGQHPITAMYLQPTMGTSTIPLQPQNPQDTQPQQLLAACTLLPQYSLLASTPQQLFPAATLPPQ